MALAAALLGAGLIALLPQSQARAQALDAEGLYAEHCASCHGADRLGGQGPALLPQNLRRLSKEKAAQAISAGLPATQMPGFAAHLGEAEIAALVTLMYTPLARRPEWGAAEIEASRELDERAAALPARPVFEADPLNLFVVVESGDHHVTILDGDRFRPIHRFKSRFALHGGAKFSADGRYVYFGSRDGWVTKYDLYNLVVVAEARAGINTRNIALSGDGRYLAVANYLPHTLVILDARDLRPLEVIAVRPARGGATSRVSAVYDARPRGSFIAALKDVAEVWEVFYRDDAPPVYRGLVHNYEEGLEEGLADQSRFPVRRIALETPLDDFFFDQDYRNLMGSERRSGKAVVVNLNVGRPIAAIEVPGMPHLGSGITWSYQGRPVMATPHVKEAMVSVIDMETWKTIKRIETLGPGFFMRSHDNTPYAWVDVFFGPHKDALHVIVKRTLEIVRTLRPAPGKTAAHVEFTRDGRYALVSIWENDGAVVVYDAATLEEVKRIPMNKPSGKYNVWNKITFEDGTSH